MKKKENWLYLAFGSLIISILSLALPIITYSKGTGKNYSYTLADMFLHADDFTKKVLYDYVGPVVLDIGAGLTVVLAFIAVAGLVSAAIGLVTLRAQFPNRSQFILTIVGLVCVAIPSLIVIFTVLLYGRYFHGKISFGPAPIISPIAIAVCIGAVMRRKNKVAEDMKREVEAKGLIRKAGDLRVR